ncbi:MAG: 3',5'-cyclic-nucleotide phosphodiesterase [Rhodoferax sp.]|nr:3',5'-cyclic-nucleotide phosphodiesterase [Rhodoferax sp.]
MKVRVLGCSGAIARDCRTTSFLIDNDVLIDAGTGVGDLTLEEMCAVEHVLLTHAHLDHIAALPLMVDAVGTARGKPLCIHALEGTLQALRDHIFNDVIWPDFGRIPTPQNPFVSFHPLHTGQTLQLGRKVFEALPAVHTVPAVGYAVTAGTGCWVFSGDTGRNPAFWERVNQLNVAVLVIETAFSNREKELALLSRHLSPDVLAEELDRIEPGRRYPVYITHTKPSQTELIMTEIQCFDQTQEEGNHVSHDIRWLKAGQEFDL